MSRGRRNESSGQGPGDHRRLAQQSGDHASKSHSPPRRGWRPRWHRYVGWWILIIAAYFILANNIDPSDIRLLPAGHRALYLIVGIITAGVGAYFLGLFDRP